MAEVSPPWLEVGQPVPDIPLTDDQGQPVRLSSFRGKKVVLYFYPADDTPGCTKEACSFRDRQSDFQKLGVVVLGVSPDGTESHQKFKQKFQLNFPLLTDHDHLLASALGAWREKNNYGKKYFGIVRSTFILDQEGRVQKLWKSVKVDGHEAKVLESLAAV